LPVEALFHPAPRNARSSTPPGALEGFLGYGVGVEYAYTMVHHAPQSAQKPQIVPKKTA